jgi:hypothetical protein
VTELVCFLIDTGGNDASVYPSPASLTGDLEVYEVDEGSLEVYDAQARLPWTSRQPPKQSAITTAGRRPASDGLDEKTTRTPDSRTLNSYRQAQ